jgi:hypothetical protein
MEKHKNISEQTEHYTKVYSQCGYIIVCNSKMHEKNVLDRKTAQISLEDGEGDTLDYLNLTDDAIDALIEALKNAKTKTDEGSD